MTTSTTTTPSAEWGRVKRGPVDPSEPTPSQPPRRNKPVLDNAVLGTLVLIVTETMFFTALVSAYLVIRAGSLVQWVPPESVRLPVLTTALNTAILTASGLVMWLAGRQFAKAKNSPQAQRTYLIAIVLGIFFVSIQGYEWVNLMRVGMTLTSSIFGATFFLIIGMHAAHAFSAILAMLWVYRRMQLGVLTAGGFTAMRLFWYLVVGVWPVLYGLVYF